MTALATIGHNNPPASEFDTLANGVEMQLEEARHWLDGSTVTTAAEADAINALDESFAKLAKELEALRKDEVKPHDDAKAAIQTRFNAFNGNTKKDGKGKIVLAREALKQALLPYMMEQDRKRDEAARKAREEADAAQRAAQQAMQARETLEQAEQAEALAKAAKTAEAQAKAADNATLGVKGEGRAKSLITTYEPVIVDLLPAIRALWKLDPAPFQEAAQTAAKRQFNAGNRSIEGVEVREHQTVRG